jgi:NAD+ kinase
MRIAIYGNSYQEEHLAEILRFFDVLSQRNVFVEVEETFYNYLCRVLPTRPNVNAVIKGNDFKAGIAISIGGDGTFLHTAQWVGDKEIPILGINTGHLGYLAATHMSDIDRWLERLLTGDYGVESRTLIAVESDSPLPDGVWPYALNEVAVLKQDTSSMIEMTAHINGSLLANYLADGLIVSTPTGSTGYNLSVGGPILEPSSPVWAVSPIAAHSLTMRPLVVCDDSVLSITTRSRSNAYRLSLDGRFMSLAADSTVTLRRAPFTTRVITRPGHHFTDTLRDKLMWGLDKR